MVSCLLYLHPCGLAAIGDWCLKFPCQRFVHQSSLSSYKSTSLLWMGQRNLASPIWEGWKPNKIMGCLPSIRCRISQRPIHSYPLVNWHRPWKSPIFRKLIFQPQPTRVYVNLLEGTDPHRPTLWPKPRDLKIYRSTCPLHRSHVSSHGYVPWSKSGNITMENHHF